MLRFSFPNIYSFFVKIRWIFIGLLLISIVNFYVRIKLTKSPPIIAHVVGGVGNQLFQYAAAYSIAKKRNSDLYICLSWYGENWNNTNSSDFSAHQRKFSLLQLNVPQENFGKCSVEYYMKGEKVETYRVDEVNVLNGDLPHDKALYVSDWFESDVFFASDKDDIVELFQPKFDTRPIDHLIQMVSAVSNSASVHIRRGDFGNPNDFRLISLDYQRAAMQLIKEKLNDPDVTFFVFTDDLDYVKKHLVDGNKETTNIIYMTEYTRDNTLYDFLLMSLCKHNIIPNSSFSWWAAYLNQNPNKIVVAPMPKYTAEWAARFYPRNHSRALLEEFAYPKDWVRMKPTFLNYTES